MRAMKMRRRPCIDRSAIERLRCLLVTQADEIIERVGPAGEHRDECEGPAQVGQTQMNNPKAPAQEHQQPQGHLQAAF